MMHRTCFGPYIVLARSSRVNKHIGKNCLQNDFKEKVELLQHSFNFFVGNIGSEFLFESENCEVLKSMGGISKSGPSSN